MTIYNLEYEKACLGSMIFSDKARMYGLVNLKADQFYDKNNGLIFNAVSKLSESGKDIDTITVYDYCKADNIPASYISNLISDGTPSSIKTYVIEIHNLYHIRKKREIAMLISDATNRELSYNDFNKLFDELMQQALNTNTNNYNTLKKATMDAMAKLDLLSHGHRGLTTLYKSLDELLIGMDAGNIVIIAARPSIGKTAFAMSIAKNWFKAGIIGGIYSFEMTREALMFRLFADDADVDYWKFRNGLLSDLESQRISEVFGEYSGYEALIDDSGGLSIEEIVLRTRLMKQRYDIKYIILDHLSYISTSNKDIKLRVYQIGYILKQLRILAKELGIVVILLCQLNRKDLGDVPVLSELRDSGEIEQDADIVMMLHREEYYDSASPKKDVMDIYVRKNREGPTGETSMLFIRNKMRFIDVPEHGVCLPELSKEF